jgi:hypothetical protein
MTIHMRSGWRILVLLLAPFLAAVSPNLFAQIVLPVRVELVQGQGQRAYIDQPFATRFAVRVLDNRTGNPVPGLQVIFPLNLCAFPPPNCELSPDPGHYLDVNSVSAITDSAGVATAGVFVAGHIPGLTGTYSYVPVQNIGSVEITLYDAVHIPNVLFGPLYQDPLPLSSSSIPTISPGGLLLLALIVAGAPCLIRLSDRRNNA